MLTLKKLTFAPLFLISFFFLIYQISPVTRSYDFIFSLSLDTLIELLAISVLIFFSSFTFTLFITIASDLRLIIPIGIIGSLIPLIFVSQALAVVFAVGILVSLLLSFLSLDSALKSYLNFQPATLLGPAIKHLSTLLILAFCLIYFLSINQIISQNGFQIPDSLIDTTLKFIPQSQSSIPQATQELADNLIKQTVKDQIQSFIKPYSSFTPAILALLLFFTLQSLTSIINLLVYPLLWIIFYILEKSGFVKFTTEMRPVKKMVVYQ